MQKTPLALAFSGGLDTSYCVPRLTEQGWQVHTVYVNTGRYGSGSTNPILVATPSDEVRDGPYVYPKGPYVRFSLTY